MKIQRMPEDIVPLLNDLVRRLTALETRPLGTVFVNETIIAKDPETGVETVIGDLKDYGEDRTGIKQWVNDTEPPAVPVMPIVTSNLGVFSIVWTGFFLNDAPMAPDFSHLNVYGNDGTSSTLVGVIKTKDEVAIVTSDSEGMYDKNWSFWFTSVDQVGNESAPGEISANNKLTPLVEAPDIQGAIDQIREETKKDFEKAMLAADGKGKIWHLPSAPTGTDHNVGDIWFDTDDSNKIYVWDGTKWDPSSASSEIPQSVLDDILTAKDKADQAYTLANGKNKRVDSTNNPPATTTDYINGDHWLKWSNLGTTGVLLQSWTVKAGKWVLDSMDPTYLPKVDIGQGTFGSLNGDRLDVNSVKADRILVSATDNLIRDPNFNFPDTMWSNLTSEMGVGPEKWSTDITYAGGARSMVLTQKPQGSNQASYAATPSDYFEVVPGDSYAAFSMVYSDAGTDPSMTTISQRVYFYDKNKNIIAGGPGNVEAGRLTNSEWVTEKWTKVGGVSVVTAPANAAYMKPRVTVYRTANTAPGTRKYYVGSVSVMRAMDSTLITPGAIQTPHIKAGAITAESGIIASLDAGKITTGSMHGKYIEVGTLMSNRLVVGDFNNYATIDASRKIDVTSPIEWATDNDGEWTFSKSGAGSYLFFLDRQGPIPFETDDQFRVSFTAYSTVAGNHTMRGYFYNGPDGGSIVYSTTITVPLKTTPDNYSYVVTVPNISSFTGTGSWVFGFYNTSAKNVRIKNVTIRRMTKGSLVVDGEILANHIHTDSIESRHIKANAVSADKIEAGAIKTSHLAVGTGRELVGNGSGQLKNNNGFEGFTYVARAADVPVGHPGYFRSTAGQKTTNFLTGDNILRIKPNTKYKIKVWVKANSTGSKVYLEPMVGSTVAGERPIPTYTFENVDVPTTWTPWEAVIQTTGAPSGTMYFRWFLNHTNGTNTNTIFYFTGFSVEEMVEGTIISDNSITTGKLMIGSFDNLIPDPTFIAGKDAWNLVSTSQIVDKASSLGGPVLRINSSSSHQTVNSFTSYPVAGGESFNLKMRVKTSVSAPARSLWVFVRAKNRDTGVETYPYVSNDTATVANKWMEFSGNITIPENTSSIVFSVSSRSTFTSGYVDYEFVSATRASSGELIVDGAIDGQIITGAVLQTHKADRTGIKITQGGIGVYDSEGSKTMQITPGTGVDYIGFFGRPTHADQFLTEPQVVDGILEEEWMYTTISGQNYLFFRPRIDGDPFSIGDNVTFSFEAYYDIDPDNPSKTSLPVWASIWTYPDNTWGSTDGNKSNRSTPITITSTPKPFTVTVPITSLASSYKSWIAGLQPSDGSTYTDQVIQERVRIRKIKMTLGSETTELNPRQQLANIDQNGDILGQNMMVSGVSRVEGPLINNGDPMDGHGSGDYGPVIMGRDLLGATYTNFFNDSYGESGSAWLTPLPHGLLANAYWNGWSGANGYKWIFSGYEGGLQRRMHIQDTVEIKNGRGYLIVYTTPSVRDPENKDGSPGAAEVRYKSGSSIGINEGSTVPGSRYYISGGKEFDNPGKTVYVVGGQDVPVGMVTFGVRIYVYDNRKLDSTETADARYWSISVLDVGAAQKGNTGSAPDLWWRRPTSTKPEEETPPPPPKPPALKTYTKTWNASWWGTWWVGNGNGRNSGLDKDGKVAQGRPPGISYNQRGLVGFPNMTGANDLNGVKLANLKKVEIYVYAAHWYSSAGGTLRIGYHGSTSKPTTVTANPAIIKTQNLAKPEGRWITLPTSVHSAVLGGSFKGIHIHNSSTSRSGYGYLTGSKTKIRVTYLK